MRNTADHIQQFDKTPEYAENNSSCNFSPNSLQRQLYLTAYSRPDLVFFPSREVFDDAMLEPWNKGHIICPATVLG
jgi:hypothetical protein